MVKAIFGRVHFLLRSISNLKSISDLRQRNLLRSFSNVKRGTFLNLPHQITFSKPSQYIQGGPSQSEYLLSSFSNLPHQITFSKPSQHIQGGPSQSEYLLSSFSNGVYVLLLKSILDFNTEKPSQVLLNCEKVYILKSP